MKKRIIKLLSCLIPIKKYRKRFRCKYMNGERDAFTPLSNNEYSKLIDIENKLAEYSETIFYIKSIVDSIAFKQSIYLNHYVDIKNVIPARAGMKQIQEERLEALNYVVDILEKHNIQYWLDGGTLLGAVRHNSFIPWDNDIDIAFWMSDRDRIIKIISEEVKNHSTYTFVDASTLRNFPSDCFYKIIRHDKYELLDLFAFDISDKYENAIYKVWWKISNTDKKYIRKPSYHFSKDTVLPLSKIKFENREYFAPNNPIKYVELQYGNYQIFPNKPYEPCILKEMVAKYSEQLMEINNDKE